MYFYYNEFSFKFSRIEIEFAWVMSGPLSDSQDASMFWQAQSTRVKKDPRMTNKKMISFFKIDILTKQWGYFLLQTGLNINLQCDFIHFPSKFLEKKDKIKIPLLETWFPAFCKHVPCCWEKKIFLNNLEKLKERKT